MVFNVQRCTAGIYVHGAAVLPPARALMRSSLGHTFERVSTHSIATAGAAGPEHHGNPLCAMLYAAVNNLPRLSVRTGAELQHDLCPCFLS